ncbi:MAG: hypothetical protein ACE5I7_06970 [Candidatus Binatia bacterium]
MRSVVVGLSLALGVGTAAAQTVTGGAGYHMRIEGVIDPTAPPSPQSILTVRGGNRLRILAVEDAQGTLGEGMSAFRNVIQYTENLHLVGSDAMLRPFHEAAPGSRLRILGLFQPDSRSLVVGQIVVVASTQGR